MFVPPTAMTARDLTSRAHKRIHDESPKGCPSWDVYGRADNGDQQPKLLISNIRHVSRAASELPFAQPYR
jgi:hypothetical protein